MPKAYQTIIATLLLVWTNVVILFGLNISPRREAALETIVNTVALLGFLIYGAIHTHELHADKRAGHPGTGV